MCDHYKPATRRRVTDTNTTWQLLQITRPEPWRPEKQQGGTRTDVNSHHEHGSQKKTAQTSTTCETDTPQQANLRCKDAVRNDIRAPAADAAQGGNSRLTAGLF